METSSSLPELLRDPRATRDFHTCYVRHLDTVNDAVMEAARRLPMVARLLATATPEQLAESQATSLQQLERALLHADWEPTFVRQRREGATYAAMGVPFQEWFDLCTAFERCLVPELIADLGGDPQRLAAAIGAMGAYVDLALRTLGEEYLRTKERIINQQQEAIQELSTPVLKLADRLLLVPLVGLIDTQRARLMTEQLLQGVRAHRAKVVVLDITGVAAVDSKVANHLLQTVSAARLMGARAIITGLSAEVAQALVTLGVDVGLFHTTGDLQGGIEEAQRLLARSR